MTNLPDLEIVVYLREKPTFFKRHKWNWKVREKLKSDLYHYSHEIYGQGAEATKELALKEARKYAADICEYQLKKAAKKKEIEDSLIKENVICEGL